MKGELKLLIKRSLAGDIRAFKKLIDMYHNRIFDLCFRMVRNEAIVQELVIRTFVTANQRLHEYDFAIPFHVWLYSIAVSCCSLHADIDKERFDNESKDDLEKLLQHVPFYPKLTLILKYIHQLTVQEMAYVLDCKMEAIKAYLREGRELLRMQRSNIIESDLLAEI